MISLFDCITAVKHIDEVNNELLGPETHVPFEAELILFVDQPSLHMSSYAFSIGLPMKFSLVILLCSNIRKVPLCIVRWVDFFEIRHLGDRRYISG